MAKYNYPLLSDEERMIAEELEKSNPWATRWDIEERAKEMVEEGKHWFDAKFETI